MDNQRICFQWGVYLIDLGISNGSVQEGVRPCVCVSNDKNNTWSSTAQFIPLTSQIKNELPMHYILSKDNYKFLQSDSVVLTEQLTVQPMNNVIKFLGRINNIDIMNIKECIKVQFNL